jgi:hypothetical protein
MRLSTTRAASLFFVCWLSTARLSAQTQTAVINGTVMDSSGASVGGRQRDRG